jgi:hypothetical protein
MANIEYSNYLEGLTPAASLDGTEIVGASKDGDAVGLTTQQIADLGGGGSVTSVAGTTNRITSTGGATPVIDIDAAYDAIIAAKAPIDSPTFTGTPTAPTPAQTVNTTQIATTEFVHSRVVNSAFVATGTNDYAITIPGITALADIKSFDVQFTNANTTPIYIGNLTSTPILIYPTLNVNSLGAVRLKKEGNVDLGTGDIKANQIYRCFYDGTNIQITKQLVQKVFNVEDYGAKHDYATVLQASVSSGSPTLTSALAGFTSGVTGKTIRVAGAGVAGADLITTMTFVNSTTVTLGVNASTTVTDKPIEWGTDDTTFIQAAINACNDYGGGVVYFPSGVYLIAGALITSLNSVNPNCQLYVPLNTTAADRVVFTFKGESPATQNNGPLGSVATYTTRKGVILKSIITGSGTTPTVLGSAFVNNGFIDINRNGIIIDRVSIEVKSKTNDAHVQPTMSAFNFYNMAWVQLSNAMAFTESPVWDSVLPTSQTYGFRLPIGASNGNYGNLYGFIHAQGFYTGVHIEEHDVAQHVSVVGCVNGLEVGRVGGGNHHSLTVIRAQIYACVNSVVIAGAPRFTIHELSIERYYNAYAGVKWYNGTADFVASSITSGCSGSIKYLLYLSGGTLTPAIFSGTFNGEVNFHDLQMEAYYQYVAGLNIVGGTPFKQLKYSGSAVSTDTAIPDFMMVHKQNGTSHIVGSWKVINEQSAAADKRLVQISGRTNGSVSKGLYRVSVHNGTSLAAVQDVTTDYISSAVPVRMPSYTVAGVPSAATAGAGATVYISNESGGAVIAFSDATNWRRVTDRAIIS